MNEQQQIPRLRFPEFSGEWKRAKVQDLVTVVAPDKRLTSDLYENEGRFPVIDQSQAYICGWTNDADALVSVDSPLIIFGDHTCVLKLVDQAFVQGADGIKILKSNKLISPLFLYQYLLCFPLSMESYKRHFSTLKEKLILYPEKESGEQQKIADCLSALDALIAAQADKLNALKTHKKGLMQQLFPRECEKVPRLRFPEFRESGDWEENGLGKVAHLRNGYAFKSAEYVESGLYKIITIANVQRGKLLLDATKKIAGLPSDIQAHQILSIGDILISMTGNVGRVCRVTSECLLLNQRVGKLIPEKIDQEFFYHFLQRDEFRNRMQRKAAGGAQCNLSAGDIVEYIIRFPTDPDEQQKIADCLSALDQLIAAQADKLDALKTHKKGLMQQLFSIR